MKFKNQFIILFISILFISCGDRNTQSKDLSNLGFYKSPKEVITKLSKDAKTAQEHFMLAVAYKSQKQTKKALFHFLNSSFSSHRTKKIRLFPQPIYAFLNGYHFKSEYYYDSVYEITSILYSYREHKYVIKTANLMKSENTIIYRNTILLKAKSLSSLKKYDEAIELLTDLLSQFQDKSSKMLINIRLASLFQTDKQVENAVTYHLKVIELKSKSWQAGISAIEILKMSQKYNFQLSKIKQVNIATSLYANKKYSQTLDILKNLKSTDAKIIYFKSLIRLNQTNNVSSFLRSHKGSKELFAKLKKNQADIYWLTGRKHKAIAIYKTLLDGEFLQDSLMKLSLFLEDRRAGNYRGYLKKFTDLYPENNKSEYFTWLLARNSIKDKNFKQALNLLQKNLVNFPNGKYSDRCRFWSYYLYNKKGERSLSLNFIKDLILNNPDSSYTWSLLKTLKKQFTKTSLDKLYRSALQSNDKEKIHFFHFVLYAIEKNIIVRDKRIESMDNYESSQMKQISQNVSDIKLNSEWSSKLKNLKRYFKIGYLNGINNELKIAPNDEKVKKDIHTALVHFSTIYKNYNISANSTLQLLKLYNLKEDISIMPKKLLDALFPLAYKNSVNKQSKKYKLNPFIILSVIKAESLYNPRAVSSAKATGLMQLMPSTAKGIAKQLKINNYNLKDPNISILFGTHYIAWLNRYYKGELPLMVAGYNAGAGNVNKWLKQLDKNDPLYFAEFVPFVETRYYILRTGKFFNQYRIIYEK